MVAPRLHRISATIPPQATAATDEPTVVGKAPYAAVVSRVTYIPEAAITGAATNNRRFVLLNRGQDGTGNVEIAAVTMNAGVNVNAFDEMDLTLSGTTANRNANAGDVLSFLSDAQGTGLADPGGVLNVEMGPQGAAS